MAVTKKLKNGEEEFTKSAIKKYLNDPSACPFCGKWGAVSAMGREERDTSTISSMVRCEECKARWWEVYVLKAIDTVRI